MAQNYLVYEYGCLAPLQGSATAIDQMFRRNRLWNALVEVERRHCSESLHVLRDETAESAANEATENLSQLRSAIAARRKDARRRSVDIADLQAEIACAK